MKKISIIIATYNSEKTLEASLFSVINQKNLNTELIIIDGGSTDRTVNILEAHSQHLDYFISEPDRGIYDAWNKGVAASTGHWISFLGSDDMLCPGILDKYEQAILENPMVDYISGKVQLINENGENLSVIGNKYNWNTFCTYMNVAHVASLHNRKLYDTYGYYDLAFKICGDYEFLLRPKNLLRTILIDEIVAKMTVGGISYGSSDALVETKKAKLKNQVKSKLSISIDYIIALVKLRIKKIIRVI